MHMVAWRCVYLWVVGAGSRLLLFGGLLDSGFVGLGDGWMDGCSLVLGYSAYLDTWIHAAYDIILIPRNRKPIHFPSSLFNPTTNPPILPLILPTHLRLISSSFSAFPETRPSSPPTNNPLSTSRTIFWSVRSLPTTPSTNHSFGPLIYMFFFFIMTLITCVYLFTTAKAKPTVTFSIMSTETIFEKRSTWGDTECFFLFSRKQIVRGC